MIVLCLVSSQTVYGGAEENQIKIDAELVEQKVLEWADSVFYYHEGYRFEGFKAYYTDDFKALMTKLDSYDKKIEDLKSGLAEDGFKGESPIYDKTLEKLERKRRKAQYLVEAYDHKARYYEILFWSNIKIKSGQLVYFMHQFRLSNHFLILSSNIKDFKGDQDASNQIVYNHPRN